MTKIFKNEYVNLSFLALLSIAAGLHLIISPETVNHWVIRGVGLIWVIEGVFYAIEIIKKRKGDKE